MKKYKYSVIHASLLAAGLSLATVTFAQEEEAPPTGEDIAVADIEAGWDIEDNAGSCCGGLVGPGSVVFKSKAGPQFSIGMTNRFIPTREEKWDYGLTQAFNNLAGGAPVIGFVANNPNTNNNNQFFNSHFSETGLVGGNYFRLQSNLFLNALANDGSWSAHMHLQYDSPLDVVFSDAGGGAGVQTSDFGLERLNISSTIPGLDWLRLHGGLEFVDMDTVEAGGLFYGDDTGALWLVGRPRDNLWFNVGYHMFRNFNNNASVFQPVGAFFGPTTAAPDVDRKAPMLFIDWTFAENHKFRFLYGYDKISNASVNEYQNAFFGIPNNTAAGTGNPNQGVIQGNFGDAKAHSHNVGGYFKGNFGGVGYMVEGIWKTGEVENVGLAGVQVNQPNQAPAFGRNSYDINSGAVAAYIDYNFTEKLNAKIMYMWGSGDGDPTDGDLNGYIPIMGDQRFSPFGGENTLINDGFWLQGIPVFSHFPEALGNGTPAFCGGIANFQGGFGYGRCDNPGHQNIMFKGSYAFTPAVAYSTAVQNFWWNEDFVTIDVVNATVTGPIPGGQFTRQVISSGYWGTEWDNTVSIGLSKAATLQLQASVLFPGSKLKDLTRATLGQRGDADSTAQRYAIEFDVVF